MRGIRGDPGRSPGEGRIPPRKRVPLGKSGEIGPGRGIREGHPGEWILGDSGAPQRGRRSGEGSGKILGKIEAGGRDLA